jgi:uncharacterized membrane protein
MPAEVMELIFRWLHFLFAFVWVGLLYFLNLVNVPTMRVLEASARPHVVTTQLPRTLFWFRHMAWATVLVGAILIYYKYWRFGRFFSDPPAITITMGAILGIIMMLNVWGIIWRYQKRIIAATAAGQTPDPAWGRIALYTSRVNFILSFPMLLFMGGASHYSMGWDGVIILGLIAAALGFVVVFTVQKWAVDRF